MLLKHCMPCLTVGKCSSYYSTSIVNMFIVILFYQPFCVYQLFCLYQPFFFIYHFYALRSYDQGNILILPCFSVPLSIINFDLHHNILILRLYIWHVYSIGDVLLLLPFTKTASFNFVG